MKERAKVLIAGNSLSCEVIVTHILHYPVREAISFGGHRIQGKVKIQQ